MTNIIAFFTSSGIPATGLSPTINIRNVVTTTLLVSSDPMIEVGDGFYKYDFVAYDPEIDYSIRCDGTATLPTAERYVYGGNENYYDDVAHSTWTATLSAYLPGPNAASAMFNLLYGDHIHVDANSGFSGTGLGVGTKFQPVDNIGDAILIADTRNIFKLMLHSSITIEADDDVSERAIETIGTMGTTVTLTAGCSANFTSFRNLDLEGTMSNGDVILVQDCSIGSLENFSGIMNVVAFLQASEVTIGAWANIIEGSAGGEPGNEPEISVNSSALTITKYSGNLKIKEKTSDTRTTIELDGGNISFDTTCVSGTIQMLGMGAIENDNSGPNCNVDLDGFISRDTIAFQVWEELVDEHGTAGTTGKKLKDLASSVILTGTVAGSGNGFNQIQLDAQASVEDGAYDPALIAIVGGTGVGQCRGIYEYDGGTRIATVDRNWKEQPDGTSEYIITAWPGREHVNEGLAQAGTSSTITLNTLASSADNVYNGQTVFLRSGKGEDQVATVMSYDGTTKIATIDPDWQVIPDVTTAYAMLPDLHLTAGQTGTSVWTQTLSGGHTAEYYLYFNNVFLKRALGLMHENIYIDQPTYDGDGNLVSARVRIYSVAGSVGTLNDVLATYQISSTGDGAGRFTYWEQVKI